MNHRSGSRGVGIGVASLVFCLGLATDRVVAADPGSGPPPAPAAGSAPPASPPPAPSSSSPPAFPALPGILADYRDLRAGPSYSVADREIRVGHLRLDFHSGTLTAVLTRSGREAGFVFDGAGHYVYTTEDAGDLQTIEKNIVANVNTNAYRGGTLSESMKACVFLSSAPLLPDILGEGAPVAGTALGGAASRLSSFLTGVDDADVGIDHAAALAFLGGGTDTHSGRMVYGEINSNVVDPGFFYDPTVLHQERLLVFRTIQGDRFPIVVSRQWTDGAPHDPSILVTNLDYALSTHDNKNADVTSVQTFTFEKSWGRVLPLDLLNHLEFFRNNWKSKTRTLDVRSVRTSDGKELPFSHRYNELYVEMPEAPAAGSSVTLRFDLAFHFLDRKDGDQYFYLNDWAMFPSLPWNWSTRATGHFKITTKKPYRAIPLGRAVASTEEGDSFTVESAMDWPTRFPSVIAGKFEVTEKEVGGVKARVHLYGRKFLRAADAYANGALEGLDSYSKILGAPYPLKEINVIELESIGYYVSPAGLIIVSRNPVFFSSPQGRIKAYHAKAFAHELAHQWFANLVMPESFPEDNWISESIAEYAGAILYASAEKDLQGQATRLGMDLDDWWGGATMSRSSVSISQAYYFRASDSDDVYAGQLLYARGPLVLHMLRTMLGDERFTALLRNVVSKYAHKTINTEQFAQEASAVVGEDMSWFFKQWITQPGIPDLDVSKSITHEAGKAYVAGHLKQRDPERFKILLLPFVYETGGTRAAALVLMDKPEMDFRVEVPADASHLVLDPGRNNLVYYH